MTARHEVATVCQRATFGSVRAPEGRRCRLLFGPHGYEKGVWANEPSLGMHKSAPTGCWPQITGEAERSFVEVWLFGFCGQ